MATPVFDHERFRDAYPEGIQRSWWHIARNAVIARAFAKRVPKDARVLEVGCGTGAVTNALRERGWDITGADLGDPSHSKSPSAHLLFNMDALMLPHEQRKTYTMLALFDVIEHIEDAPLFLRALLEAFPNARQVILTVPAGKNLWTDFDDHYGHHRRYDRPLLQAELLSAGMRPERVAYFFHALYPVIALNNLFRGRKRKIRFVAPSGWFALAANRFFGRLFAIEARILPSTLPGSSIIAIARRA